MKKSEPIIVNVPNTKYEAINTLCKAILEISKTISSMSAEVMVSNCIFKNVNTAINVINDDISDLSKDNAESESSIYFEEEK